LVSPRNDSGMAIGPRGGDNTGMMVMSCSVSDFFYPAVKP
jgi:hypothetical protein